jgi:hypothetical protein
MPKGVCDPGPGAFNEMTLTQDGLTCVVRYGWDGVSVFPDCNGPVEDVHLTNPTARTVWVLLPRKGSGNKWEAVLPGADITLTKGGQLNSRGLSTYDKFGDIVTTTINPAP